MSEKDYFYTVHNGITEDVIPFPQPMGMIQKKLLQLSETYMKQEHLLGEYRS